LFVLARESALRELLGSDAAVQAQLKQYIGTATMWMIFGWATGGIFFGMMSDKIGRVKTMVATLLVYSGFTGLSGFAHSWVDFTVYRFLVGLGVGGMGRQPRWWPRACQVDSDPSRWVHCKPYPRAATSSDP
jgi:MFS family permease